MNYAGVRIKRYLRLQTPRPNQPSASSSRTNHLQSFGFNAAYPVVLAGCIGVRIERMQVATTGLHALILRGNLRMNAQIVAKSEMPGDFRRSCLVAMQLNTP